VLLPSGQRLVFHQTKARNLKEGMLDVFWSFSSLVEYVTCMNTVSNIIVLYDH
jgi:hypothetical protein